MQNGSKWKVKHSSQAQHKVEAEINQNAMSSTQNGWIGITIDSSKDTNKNFTWRNIQRLAKLESSKSKACPEDRSRDSLKGLEMKATKIPLDQIWKDKQEILRTREINLDTNHRQALAKVLTLAEKTLVQHFHEHLVGVGEASYKSTASHHGFSTHAHAWWKPAKQTRTIQAQQKW